MKTMITALKIFLFLTILTGIVYPLFITGIASLVFPRKAGGSIVYRNNKPVGSELIGQKFDTTIYFSSRPSATGYNALPSGGSNLGPTSKKLRESVNLNKKKFILFNKLDTAAYIPPEMVFASASGLDPDISVSAALLQVNRIAKARNFNDPMKEKLVALVKKDARPPQFGFLGEERINVLLLNLDLDKLK